MKRVPVPFENVRAGDMADHKSKSLDPRPVAEVWPEFNAIQIEFPGGLRSSLLDADAYDYFRLE